MWELQVLGLLFVLIMLKLMLLEEIWKSSMGFYAHIKLYA